MLTKTSRCKVCKSKFDEPRYFPEWCSVDCALVLAERRLAKIKRAAELKAHREKVKERKADQVTRDSQKTRSEWLAEAKTAIQQFRRLEELAKGSGCMSCGRTQQEVQGTDGWKPGGAWDGGHFIGKGARPEIALEPLNIWLQCKSCNAGSGKYTRKGYTVNAAFRLNLIDRIGLEQVEWLEGPHEAKHYDIDQLKAIKSKYAALTRQLKANQ